MADANDLAVAAGSGDCHNPNDWWKSVRGTRLEIVTCLVVVPPPQKVVTLEAY